MIIHYAVSDGIVSVPTQASLSVSVLASSSTELLPPVAEPDVAQAIVGMPVTLQPLANDLPGADPTNPQAHLTLAAPVGEVPGAVVTTDIRAGTVTFTAQRPGPFFLTYQAAFGAARTSRGTIRIQASPAGSQPQAAGRDPGHRRHPRPAARPRRRPRQRLRPAGLDPRRHRRRINRPRDSRRRRRPALAADQR